ncbi:MAG: HD domain-containing protein [Patescibacteria group bacterium]
MDRPIALGRLREFMRFITAFGKVERAYYIPATDRKENDLEHTCSLALMAWFILSGNNSSLDTGRVLKYALAHDLVEVFAGDTYIYTTDKEHLDGKPGRELAAAEQIARDFPEFADLHPYVLGYMKREDAESRFVYALDKILPIFSIHDDEGRMWKENKVKLQMLIDNKASKVALSPEIEPYFAELVELLTLEEEKMFGA